LAVVYIIFLCSSPAQVENPFSVTQHLSIFPGAAVGELFFFISSNINLLSADSFFNLFH